MFGLLCPTHPISIKSAGLALLFTAPILLLDPSVAAGQPELTVYTGVYGPQTPVLKSRQVFMTLGLVELEHEVAPAVGARLTVWPSRLLGVEAAASLAFSGVTELRLCDPPPAAASGAYCCASRFQRSGSGSVVTASTRGLLRLFVTSRTSVHVLGGVGLVSRHANAYDIVDGTTSPMLVTGVGFRSHLSPRLALRADFEDQISWPDFQLRSGVTESEPTSNEFRGLRQADLLFTLGLSMRLW